MTNRVVLRQQQVFMTSRNWDAGSPNDCYMTFPNSFVNSNTSANSVDVDIELVEFSIPRLWYDVYPGINDTFTLRRKTDGASAVITIEPGFYTAGDSTQEILGGGASITSTLARLLSQAIDNMVWTVTIDNKTGTLSFNAVTGVAQTTSYVLDFSVGTAPRTHELLGFSKGAIVTTKIAYYGCESAVGTRPYNLMRTSELVLHTDIRTREIGNSLDNYGNAVNTPFMEGDVLATIRVDQPPRGVINYLCQDQVNTLSVGAADLRVVRFYITDDRELPINLDACEWTGVFKITYTTPA